MGKLNEWQYYNEKLVSMPLIFSFCSLSIKRKKNWLSSQAGAWLTKPDSCSFQNSDKSHTQPLLVQSLSIYLSAEMTISLINFCAALIRLFLFSSTFWPFSSLVHVEETKQSKIGSDNTTSNTTTRTVLSCKQTSWDRLQMRSVLCTSELWVVLTVCEGNYHQKL